MQKYLKLITKYNRLCSVTNGYTRLWNNRFHIAINWQPYKTDSSFWQIEWATDRQTISQKKNMKQAWEAISSGYSLDNFILFIYRVFFPYNYKSRSKEKLFPGCRQLLWHLFYMNVWLGHLKQLELFPRIDRPPTDKPTYRSSFLELKKVKR